MTVCGLDDTLRYQVAHWPGIAVRIDREETEPDDDTEWSGIEEPTGRVLVVMVGDDVRTAVDPEDLTPIEDADYCSECGQIGCAADGRE